MADAHLTLMLLDVTTLTEAQGGIPAQVAPFSLQPIPICSAGQKPCAAQLFAVAIRRASKCAAWATSYAQLCAQLRAAGEPSGQHRAVESAVQGRATAEYCKLSVRTVSITPQGTPKSTGQVGSQNMIQSWEIYVNPSVIRAHVGA